VNKSLKFDVGNERGIQGVRERERGKEKQYKEQDGKNNKTRKKGFQRK